MGRTWPNLEGKRVESAGYYWNEKLKKLARLQVGEKLPKKPGRWEFFADEFEGSSSEIVRRLFDRYPGMDVNDFTFTVRSPVGRRLPIGDHPSRSIFKGLFKLSALLLLGAVAWATFVDD